MIGKTDSDLLPSSSPEDILAAWRERIFTVIFLSILIIAVVPYVTSAIHVIHEKRWGNLAAYTLGYLCIIMIVFVRRIPFKVRVISGLATFYLLGLTALISIGPVGSGRTWLFAFSIIASLVLGLRAGFVTLVLNTATLLGIGFLLNAGRLEWGYQILNPLKTWVVTSITFAALNTVITISLAVLIRGLKQNLIKEHNLTRQLTGAKETLEQEHGQLLMAKEALLHSEKTLAQAIQGNSIPTFIIDSSHTITHWNNACEILTGFSEAQMKGTQNQWKAFYPQEKQTLADLIVDGAADQQIAALFGSHAKKSIWIDGAFEGENFYPHLKENGRWLFYTAAPIKDPAGNISGAIETIQDITDRKQDEDRVRNSETQLRTLLRTIPDLVWLKDEQGVYLACNSTFERFFGAKEADIVGKTDYDFVPREQADFFRKHDKRAMERKKPSINEETVVFADDGHRELLETIKTPMYRSDGQLAGVLGIGRNITERVNLQNQLVQAQKMESIGRLAGGVAHDYNNALSVILGYTELALADADPAGSLHAYLTQVFKAGSRAKEITRQLLAFARKQTIAPRVLDLNHSVESMLKMIRRLIGEDIDLVWMPDSDLWPVKMDPSQIDQILANLCLNARDAIGGVGRITIETATKTVDEAYCGDHAGFVPGEFALLAVSDNGCGMDKEILSNMFEPFFTTKDVDKGTGLGLATVYGIVKQNSGFINVYSEPGSGTTIKIYLPRQEGMALQVDDQKREKPPLGRGETIVLVEDDLSILTLAEKILKDLGYAVLASGTPKEAVRKVQEHAGRIDLILTDVIMPEMNGLELANRLQSHYPSLKRIFMSGYTANAIAHRGILDEGVHFIQKPFTRMELAAIVRNVLDE